MNRSNLIDNRENVEKNKKYNSIPSDRFYTEKEEATLRFYRF